MTSFNELLQDIVSEAREATEFYEFAAGRVAPPYLSKAFARVARVKADLVCALQVALVDHPERRNGATQLFGIVRRMRAGEIYASARAALQQDPPAQYLDELIDGEERILEALYHVVDVARFDESHPRIMAILRLHLPRMHLCHDAMRRARIRMALSHRRQPGHEGRADS